MRRWLDRMRVGDGDMRDAIGMMPGGDSERPPGGACAAPRQCSASYRSMARGHPRNLLAFLLPSQ
ncbi:MULTISPECIES: hypothetical protein [unclassified Sphingomonas]|uniref:hypothetical protein n=1 Tax=unclassified Sphingomonas TaxID=196159 RepID=UPI0012E16733|nr:MULTISPECIES: hypothetical protein [unclassified Sphingomonas]